MLLKITNLIIKYCVYVLVFLMPIFWLSYTFEVYEFNKLYLLFYVSIIALAAWLVKMFAVEKKLTLRRTALDVPILIFLAVIVISSIFSKDAISSWLGYYGRFTDASVGLLSLAIMYFVIVNNVKTIKGEAKSARPLLGKIYSLLLGSTALVVISAYLSAYGLWTKLPLIGSHLPPIMGLQTFNPAATSAEGMAVFLAAMISLLVGHILISLLTEDKSAVTETTKVGTIKKLLSFLSKFRKPSHYVLLFASVVLLLMINFWAAWLAVVIAMVVLLIVAFWTRAFRSRINSLILPIILLIISIASMTMNVHGFLGWKDLPSEVMLDYQTAKTVTWQAFKENPVLGSGPGNFAYSFSKYKPTEFNDSQFWNIRFDKSPSHLMDLVATTGALGILSYLALILIFLFIAFKAIRKTKVQLKAITKFGGKSSLLLLAIPMMLAWVALFIGQITYLQNMTLAFSFWLVTALTLVAWQDGEVLTKKKTVFSFDRSPELGLVLTTLLAILSIVFLGLLYTASKYYIAETTQRQLGQEENQNLVSQTAILEKTVNQNSNRVNYRINLSRLYLTGAWEEARKPENERDLDLLRNLAAASISQAQAATQLGPNLVMTWENAGLVYRDLRVLVTGANEEAIKALDKAAELEPTNPLFYREICRLKLASGVEENWEETLNYCQTAIDLKPNYLDAYVQLALAYERTNDIEKGIANLEIALDKLKGVKFEPGSQLATIVAEIYFQLGRLHFNAGRGEKAVEMFQQAIIVVQSHSNARYGLATAYESAGQIPEAIEQFTLVSELNPDNQAVKQRIEQLKSVLNQGSLESEQTEDSEEESSEGSEETDADDTEVEIDE